MVGRQDHLLPVTSADGEGSVCVCTCACECLCMVCAMCVSVCGVCIYVCCMCVTCIRYVCVHGYIVCARVCQAHECVCCVTGERRRYGLHTTVLSPPTGWLSSLHDGCGVALINSSHCASEGTRVCAQQSARGHVLH